VNVSELTFCLFNGKLEATVPAVRNAVASGLPLNEVKNETKTRLLLDQHSLRKSDKIVKAAFPQPANPRF